jgi:hypothetical protein
MACLMYQQAEYVMLKGGDNSIYNVIIHPLWLIVLLVLLQVVIVMVFLTSLTFFKMNIRSGDVNNSAVLVTYFILKG